MDYGPDSIIYSELGFISQHKKVFPSDGVASPDDKCNTVAVAPRYGLVFCSNENTIKVFQSHTLFNDGEPPPLVVIDTVSPVTHLSTSCDGLTLLVVVLQEDKPKAVFYEIRSLLPGCESPSPFAATPLNGVRVQAIAWNPMDPSSVAIATSPEDLSILSIKDDKIDFKSKAIKACALSWSPKGKQLTVGLADGALALFKPDLTLVRNVKSPPMEEASAVQSITWFTNTEFFIGYRLESEEGGQVMMYVNAPKAQEPKFILYEYICNQNEGPRPAMFYQVFLQEWSVLCLASSRAPQLGVLGLAQGVSEGWSEFELEEGRKADMHSVNITETTYPMGMAIDFTSQKTFTNKNDGSVSGPGPVIYAMSTGGELNIFHVINSRPEVVSLVAPPEALPKIGHRTAEQYKGSVNLVLSLTRQVTSQPVANPFMSSSPAMPVAGGQVEPPKLMPSSNDGPTSTFGGSLFGGTTPARTLLPKFTTQAPLTAGFPTQTPLTAAFTSQAPFTAGLTTQAPLTAGFATQAPLTAGFNTQAPLTAGFTTQAPLTAGFTTQAPLTAGFTTQAPLTSGFAAQAPLTSGFAAQTPLTSGFAAQTPLTAGFTTQTPLTAGIGSGMTLGKSSPIQFNAPIPSPGFFSQAPDSKDSQRMKLSSQGVGEGRLGGTPLVVSMPIKSQAPSPIPSSPLPKPAESQTLSKSPSPLIASIPASTKEKETGDKVRLDVISDILSQFEEELGNHNNRESNFEIGSRDEMGNIRRSLVEESSWIDQMSSTTTELCGEITQLHYEVLQGFKLREEAEAQIVKSKNPRHFSSMQSRQLDPHSRKTVEDIRSKYQYLQSQLEEVNTRLHLDWVTYTNAMKNKKKRDLPISETVYNALMKCHTLRTRQEREVELLCDRLKALEVDSLSRGLRINRPHNNDDVLASLEKSLNEVKVTPSSYVSPIKMLSPGKQQKLQKILSRRDTIPVRKCSSAAKTQLMDLSHYSNSLRQNNSRDSTSPFQGHTSFSMNPEVSFGPQTFSTPNRNKTAQGLNDTLGQAASIKSSNVLLSGGKSGMSLTSQLMADGDSKLDGGYTLQESSSGKSLYASARGKASQDPGKSSVGLGILKMPMYEDITPPQTPDNKAEVEVKSDSPLIALSSLVSKVPTTTAVETLPPTSVSDTKSMFANTPITAAAFSNVGASSNPINFSFKSPSSLAPVEMSIPKSSLLLTSVTTPASEMSALASKAENNKSLPQFTSSNFSVNQLLNTVVTSIPITSTTVPMSSVTSAGALPVISTGNSTGVFSFKGAVPSIDASGSMFTLKLPTSSSSFGSGVTSAGSTLSKSSFTAVSSAGSTSIFGGALSAQLSMSAVSSPSPVSTTSFSGPSIKPTLPDSKVFPSVSVAATLKIPKTEEDGSTLGPTDDASSDSIPFPATIVQQEQSGMSSGFGSEGSVASSKPLAPSAVVSSTGMFLSMKSPDVGDKPPVADSPRSNLFGSVFSTSGTTTTTTTTSSSSLFQTTISSTSGGLFGVKSTSSGSVFGTSTVSSSMFKAPETTTIGGSLFGGTSTTGGIFGTAKTTESGSSIFASAKTAESGSIFGGVTSSSSSSSSSGSIFGGATMSAGNLLGSKMTTPVKSTTESAPSTTATTMAGSTVGTVTSPSSGVSLFGGVVPPTVSSGSVFGGVLSPSSTTGTMFSPSATSSGVTGFGSSITSASGSTFGQPSATSSAGTTFGQPSATSSAGSTFGLPSATSSAGSTFGQPSATSSAGSTFGQSSATSSAGTTFGQPSATSSAGSTFGQPSATSSAGSTFGQPSATSSAGSTFGQPSATSSAGTTFGQPSATLSAGSTFGQPSATSSAGSPFGQPSAFGSLTPATTTVTGFTSAGLSLNVPSTTTSSGGSMFGQKSDSVFGQTSQSSSSSLFGGQPATGSIFGGATQTQGSSVFGSSAPQGTSIFGGASTQASATPSLFGQSVTSSSGTSGNGIGFGQSSPAATLPFAAASTTTQNASSPFSSSGFGVGTSSGGGFFSGLGSKPSEENANKNIFGSTTFASAKPQLGLFGGGGQTSTSSFGAAQTNTSSTFGSPGFGGAASSGGGSGEAPQSAFGMSTPQKSPGFANNSTFGGSAVFGGTPAFNSPPKFGNSPAFGSTASFGSIGTSTFGSVASSTPPATGGFGGFSGQNTTATFGGIAQQSPVQQQQQQQQPSSFGGAGAGPAAGSPFGGSSSFSTWR